MRPVVLILVVASAFGAGFLAGGAADRERPPPVQEKAARPAVAAGRAHAPPDVRPGTRNVGIPRTIETGSATGAGREPATGPPGLPPPPHGLPAMDAGERHRQAMEAERNADQILAELLAAGIPEADARAMAQSMRMAGPPPPDLAEPEPGDDRTQEQMAAEMAESLLAAGASPDDVAIMIEGFLGRLSERRGQGAEGPEAPPHPPGAPPPPP